MAGTTGDIFPPDLMTTDPHLVLLKYGLFTGKNLYLHGSSGLMV